MAKKTYIGVDGVARKVKKGYVGVNTEVPVYDVQTTTANITSSNISTYFTVTNGSYYFYGSGSTFTTTNGGIGGSTASTKLTAKQDMDVSFTYSYASEANWDKFTLTVDGTTVENAVSGASTTKSYSGTLKAGSSIEFAYTKDGSVDSNGDECTFSNMSITTKVTTQTGTEYKEIARKIKKAYIGIGGVARPCWSGGELAYYGTITPLSVARSRLAATTVGNYALFGGGCDSNGHYKTVDAYDTSLTRKLPMALYNARSHLAATTVGNYALFGGGSGGGVTVLVEAYDTSLTRTAFVMENTLSEARYELAATSVGNYALFGGGSNSSTFSGVVDAYDTSLTRMTATRLDSYRTRLAATSVGSYALFGGGYNNTGSYYRSNIIDAYDTSLTRTTPTTLIEEKDSLAATTVGQYALFGGGWGSSYTNTVDAYDTSLTRTTPTTLSKARDDLAATSIGDYALFGGGYSYTNTVDAYDTSLTRTTPTTLNASRAYLAATSVGNYAIFGGGESANSEYNVVDVYTIA